MLFDAAVIIWNSFYNALTRFKNIKTFHLDVHLNEKLVETPKIAITFFVFSFSAL